MQIRIKYSPDGKSSDDKTNLLNPSKLKRSIGADYLTFRDAKKGGKNPKKSGNNTKKRIKAARSSNYLTSDAKKAFNYLRYAFTQALILQHFDLEQHIKIKIDATGYIIGGVLSQLISNNLGQ